MRFHKVKDKEITLVKNGEGENYITAEAMARSWLMEWGGYWQMWRDRKNLGYPTINILHASHGVSSSVQDIPEMPPNVQFVDFMIRNMPIQRRKVAWVAWVEEPGWSKVWQRSCLARRYNIELSKPLFDVELGNIVTILTGCAMSLIY